MDYNTFYSEASQRYDSSRLDMGDVFDSTVSYIKSHLSSTALVILDIGCGTGAYAFALQKQGYLIEGIDKSPTQVALASKKIHAMVGDILSLQRADSSVDVVLMIMMLHQIEDSDLDKAFSEVVRILRPGGKVIIKTCFEDDISRRLTSKYFPSCLSFDKNRYHSKERIISANPNLVLRFYDKVSIPIYIPKDDLIGKLRKRGASNIGILSDMELEQGVAQILKDNEEKDTIEVIFDNSFLVFECLK